MRLDQVRFTIPTGELVTVTVDVSRAGQRPGGPERRRAEEIAAELWMIIHEPEPAGSVEE